jgi:three-Cys-motif partner protein
MATGDFTVASDKGLAISIGPWAKEKLHYIKRYCEIFNTGMKNSWPVRCYIDLFAGPGICIVEKSGEELLGSPLVALTTPTPFSHYYFNDTDTQSIQALQIRANKYKTTNVKCFNKDCDSVIVELLPQLPKNSLDFCFIDPFKWEIKFDSIRKLTENRRMDLAITFHVGNMKRVANDPPVELRHFFSDETWISEYRQAKEVRKSTGRALLDAYERGLSKLGYLAVKDYILQVNSNNVPLYHLVFASKSARGTDFWDKIASRSEAGQIRMF